MFFVGCGDDKKEETTPAAPAAVTYADIKTIVDTNCAKSGCHSANGTSPDLSTEAGLKASKTSTLVRIALVPGATSNTLSVMPDGYTGTTAWNASAGGAKVKAFLDAVK